MSLMLHLPDLPLISQHHLSELLHRLLVFAALYEYRITLLTSWKKVTGILMGFFFPIESTD